MTKRDARVEPCSLIDAGCAIVVNPSNARAALGSGVSRAILDECGGLAFQEEVRRRLDEDLDGKLGPGDCLVTTGGSSARLRHVLHVLTVEYEKGLGSTTERVTLATEAALEAATTLGSEAAPARVAFPLLAAGHGGLAAGVSLKAMVDGLKAFFRESPDAPIGCIVFAVPEPDEFAVARARLGQLLVLPNG
jgi:O-acetyl-ADP-ribose deacetylase (regulator of RNase III)